jgi:23S rRNA (cytosine1962-C5)-methyltransferase
VDELAVTARGANRLRAGHPWIFRADVIPGNPYSDCVRVTDERGRPLGSATFAPPPAPIALRVYAREPDVSLDAILAERIRRSIARRGGAQVARLVHAEADLIPGLIVDRWGDAAVVQAATAAIDRREEAIARVLTDELGLRIVVRRDDGSMRDHEALPRAKGVLLGGGPTLVQVREGEATLELDLLEDAKTGGFLDQRENHLLAATYARGEALDAFTYHGGFALALARRADRVTAIDESAAAIDRARRNATLSKIANVSFETADAFQVLRELERAGRTFDVAVVDPPALAKRSGGSIEQALRAYKELNLRALRLVKPDGILVTCSCSGRVTGELFDRMLADAARDARRDAAILERRGAATDHPVLLQVPETEYLKCRILRVL